MSADRSGTGYDTATEEETSNITWTAIKAAMPPGVVAILAALRGLDPKLGVEFSDDPVGYFQALIAEFFLQAILSIFGFFGLKIQQAWGLFTGVLEDSGGAVYGSIAYVGASILGVFTGFEATLTDLAASSPLGLLVALFIWMALAYAAVYVATWLWIALKKAIPLVIPWL